MSVHCLRPDGFRSVRSLSTDWATGVPSPTGTKEFSSSLCAQTGSGTQTPAGGHFTATEARPGRDDDHSAPSSAEFKNELEQYSPSAYMAKLFVIVNILRCGGPCVSMT